MAYNSANMITLKSSDGKEISVPTVVAMRSRTIRNGIELIDDYTSSFFVVPIVNARILSMVIEYCTKHADAEAETHEPMDETSEDGSSSAETPGMISPKDELKNWDKQFLDVDNTTFCDLINAAHYLDIEDLLDITCQKVADMLKGKTPEETRQLLGIESDFTPEEEEKFRWENQWAFD